ncbi:ABC transporter permease subunit [Actinospica robiniae]|uniref:ABC transporter permease subunit n=1 Tax=Actinospica robiniae TaxID=304901 RepID=UPI000554963C
MTTAPADTPPNEPGRPRRGGARLLRRRLAPYTLIAPTLALLGTFLLFPIGTVLYDSLRHDNPTEPWDNGFAGLDNFRRLLHDSTFWSSLAFTGKWVVLEVALQLALGLALALMLNETFVGRSVARALVFSPWAVSGVLTTSIWLLLYNPATGVLHYLSRLGVGSPSTAVLSDPSTVVWAAVLAELWRGVPFFAILLLADLQSIPKELYEASSVDGAGRTRRFVHVTLPHLRDAVVLATLLRGVWEFNNVDLLYTLTGGGPAGQTTTLPLYVAQTARNSYDFGYGSALTTAAFVILLFFCIVYLRLSKFGEER